MGQGKKRGSTLGTSEQGLDQPDVGTEPAEADRGSAAPLQDTFGNAFVQALLTGDGGMAAAEPPVDGSLAEAAVADKGSGSALDGRLRGRMEARLGADLGGVRVHDDSESQVAAASIGARAFAFGEDVFLGQGERASDTELMAHELTHVAQQAGGAGGLQADLEVASQQDPAEREADAVAGEEAQGTVHDNIESADAGHFEDVAGGNLHLSVSSSAIDAGGSLAAGACDEDIDGDLRDADPDVGADEQVSEER